MWGPRTLNADDDDDIYIYWVRDCSTALYERARDRSAPDFYSVGLITCTLFKI